MSALVKGVVEANVQPGLYPGLANEVYHACPGISNSGLAQIDKSPWHYYSRCIDPKRPPAEEKPGQFEGELMHCALLEPDQFDTRYVLGPTLNRNTKAWKEWVAHNTQDGRVAIQGDQYEKAMAQAASARALPDVAAAVVSGDREVSAFWRDPVTGVLCRCRPDFVHDAGNNRVVLLDAKGYSSADPHEFARQAARKGYHRQAAYYSDGYALAAEVEVLAFVFVVVETEYPYAASAVMLDDESMAAGRTLYRRNLNSYADCLKKNIWPSYSSAIELVRLPNYAMENGDGY